MEICRLSGGESLVCERESYIRYFNHIRLTNCEKLAGLFYSYKNKAAASVENYDLTINSPTIARYKLDVLDFLCSKQV